MKLTTRWRGSVAIVDLEGVLTAYGESEPLYRKVERSVRGAGNGVVLNLAGVERMDAAGVGELVLLRLRLEAGRCALKLVGVSRRLRGILDLVGLLAVFAPVDSEREAVASLEARSVPVKRSAAGNVSPWKRPAVMLAQKPM